MACCVVFFFVQGDKAWLESSPLSSKFNSDVGEYEITCFRFWYQMVGDSVGHLKVIYAKANDTLRSPIWELYGNQSSSRDEWLEGVIPLTGTDDDYMLIFEGSKGLGSVAGFIAYYIL